MVARPLSLKDQVVEVSFDYLGPASERFIDRQISTHLKKNPGTITAQDLLKLVDWLKLSFALLTNDTRLVNEYGERLLLVADGKATEALSEQWSQN